MSPGLVAENPPPLDLLGAATGTAAVGGLTFVIVQGRAWGFLDPRIVAIAATAIVSGAVFFRSSLTHDEPLFDLELLKIPSFRVITVAGAVLSTSTSATWFLYPLFMNDVWGYSNLQIGLAMTPGPAALVLVTPLAGRLVDRYGYRELLILGATMATLGTAWMAWRLRPDETYLTAFFPGTCAIGFGMAFMLGPANAAALRDIPKEQLGSANAAYNMARMACATFGVAITTAIIGNAPVGQRLEEFQVGWWTMTAIMSLSPLLLILRFPRDQRTTIFPAPASQQAA